MTGAVDVVRGGEGPGRGGGGMKGDNKVVESHRPGGVFIAKGMEDKLCTMNMVLGEAAYNEKLVHLVVNPGCFPAPTYSIDKCQNLLMCVILMHPVRIITKLQ